MRYIISGLTVLILCLLWLSYLQYQKLEAYRELVRVSDELISIQEDNISKQERLIKLLSN